ncbi:patched family-domain-containing protein [Phakopsora pachyrhizi]|nr:patched family-domain-containing protein [Phakopsora pachyrhizi]
MSRKNEDEDDGGIGRCAMYDNCGKKDVFGQELPCPDGNRARKIDQTLRLNLEKVCGQAFSQSIDSTCCTIDQLSYLSKSVAQAEPLISTCPACRNNFVKFYCHFTCSPDQASFVNVTSTQKVKNSKTDELNQAVKSLDFWVDPGLEKSFFESCKDVKFSATNGYVMDLIGGGAKTPKEFLRYMGDERPGLGSPFQINFPSKDPSEHQSIDLSTFTLSNLNYSQLNKKIVPLRFEPHQCFSQDLDSRCACADCPTVCPSLPPAPPLFIPSPSSTSKGCKIGQMRCGDFAIVFIYSLVLSSFLLYTAWKEVLKRRRIGLIGSRGGDNDSGYETPSGYERVSMNDPLAPNGSSLGDDTDSGEEEQEGNNGPEILLNPAATTSRSSNPLIGASLSMAGREAPVKSRSIGSISPNGYSFFQNRHLRRGSSDPDSRLMGIHYQPRSYTLNAFLSRVFYLIGHGCATKPYLTIGIALLCCGLLNLGWSKFEIEQDPVNLWVAKGSRSALEKADFESRFGPFYRTEQIFLTSLNEGDYVLNYESLRWIFDLEQDIRSLESPSGLNLASVCLAPTSEIQPPRSTSYCVVQSIMGYFGNSLDGIDEENWAEKLNECASSPSICLSSYGQPLAPKMVLGGLPSSGNSSRVDTRKATAAVITFVVNNHLDGEKLRRAKEWEETLRNHLESLTKGTAQASKLPASAGLKMSWSTEISLQGEINKSTNTDIPIVVLSYLAMFLYVAINLGGSGMAILSAAGRVLSSLFKMAIPRVLRPRSDDDHRSTAFPARRARSTSLKRQLLVESKFSLALLSIGIVLLSVSTSVGFFSLFGVKITLIIAEVIPFLVLAIGVDNVFILANEVSRQNYKAYSILARGGIGYVGVDGTFDDDDENEEDEIDELPSVEVRIGKAISRMGPSVLLSASCETVAFALGAIVGMPAVRNFAIYAAGAVMINTILQMTIFVSAIAVDLHRMESNRVDCMPCVKLKSANSVSDLLAASGESNLATFIRTIYAPFLMKRSVKIFALCAFSGLFVFSTLSMNRIKLGLDQRLALPPESHLVGYFDALDKYFDVGPPVYFVSEGLNVTDRSGQQALCSRFSSCQELSIGNVLEAERKRPESSFIAQPPSVWIDDFFQWLNPSLESCCRVKKTDASVFCSDRDRERSCQPCYKDKIPPWNITMEGLPEGDMFMRYLKQWLKSPTTESCPVGGRAGYYNAINITTSDSQNFLDSSHFRSFHTPLKSQADYINSLSSARRIAREMAQRIGGTVYPYSVFYVFFDQYSYILGTSIEVILLALLAVFVVSSVMLGSWRTGGVMCLTVFMIVINITGAMGAWRIDLNAISLVNLVIGVGIGVEFCSHIARAFVGANGGGLPLRHPKAQKDRDERVCLALSDVGSSVFAGIFSTKIIGISILGLTKSKLLEVRYLFC